MNSESESLSEEPVKENVHPNNDFPSMGVDLVKKINFKVAFFLLLVSMLIFSDVFMENIIPTKYSMGGVPDTKGTMIQLLMLVMAYIVIDLMVKGEIL